MANGEIVNILVVDDLPEKLLVYETILEGLGQNVVTARSGREALRHLLEREFAVILLDVNMPDMDGFETAAMIRSRRQTAHTPIIFITAFNDEMHTAQGYSLGAVDYILSPVVPEILCTKVGVFVDLYKKTEQVKRQAEQRVALVREQAARAAAEEATRHLAFLAEASTVLARSLEYQAIPKGLARHAVPFLGDLCAVTLIDENDPNHSRTELAWIDPRGGPCTQVSVPGVIPLASLADLSRRVLETGAAELHADLRTAGRDHDAAAALPLPGRARRAGSRSRAALRDRRPAPGARAVLRHDRAGPPRPWPAATGRRTSALAEDLAGRAAIAIDNARLYRDIQENDRRKNEFLAMLAHELRNPLAPIRNAVEVLRRLGLEDADLHWANDVIIRQVEHLVRLVDDLLDISRITGGQDPASQGADRPRRGRDPRRRDQPPADRRTQARADRLASRRAASSGRRQRAARPGPLEPPEQRGEVHRGRRQDRAGSRRGSTTRPSSGSATTGSASPPRCSPASSTCSPRWTARSTAPRGGWGSA